MNVAEAPADGAPAPLTLTPDTIHLIAVDLASAGRQAEELATLLPDDQRAALTGGAGSQAWRRRLIARACLRRILGRCSGAEPRSLRIVTGSKGKPYLSRPAGLHFNASHSGALLLVGVALDLEIGVDVELIRPIDDVTLIADHHLSEAECGDLRSLPPAGRTAAFYAVWTRKEAFVKATGLGLGGDFRAFDVTLRPEQPARVTALRGRWSAERPDAWRIHGFRPRAGFVAAVAVRSRHSRLRWIPAASEPLHFPSSEERPA